VGQLSKRFSELCRHPVKSGDFFVDVMFCGFVTVPGMEWILTSHTGSAHVAKWKLRLHFALLLAFCPNALAQSHDRLNAPLDGRKQVTLRGTRNPRVERLTDDGPIAPMERIQGMGFRFRPTAKQSAALEQLLEDQQNPSSPLYHAWLSPEEFGDRFGLSQNDYARVSEWIESQGFQIDASSRSRTWITFSGTADHVRRAFGADLRRFHVDGRPHFANVAEARIPADLEPLVHTLRGVDDLPDESRRQVKPRLNLPSGGHALGPDDLATIYNIKPLLQKGYNGAGQKIVVTGKSALKMADLRAFRDLFGLPQNDPKVILVPGFPDPGMNEEFLEVTADVELAGSIARNASIIYVYAPNAYAAAEYAIDQNLAPVISNSFGDCEKHAASQMALVASTRAMAQQANAQGITWVASSGDTGVAACESQRADDTGVSGIGVLHPASFPEVTGVGGTMFVEGAGYWSPGYTRGAPTALSYIPETVWNETPNGKLATSGGGASMFFARPSWQAGPGVPNGNARLVPDVSFAADWDHDPYIVLADDATWNWGGTSAATPVFAGVLTILNQYLVSTGAQSKPGLGNINPRLYQMAQTKSGVFHDITTGDNFVPCKTGTPDCTTGRYGYTAASGWDATTGLGSIDVNNFVLAWPGGSSTPSVTSTSVTATANPSTLSATASTVVTAVVKPGSGATLPTGPVYFSVGETSLGYADLATSGGAASASITVKGNQLAAGANTVVAFYGGASTFLSSTGTVIVTVSGAAGTASSVTASAQPSRVYKSAPDADGLAWYFTLQLAETAGVATKVTGFSIEGSDYSEQIPFFFGSTTLPARGTLTAPMRTRITTVPADRTFAFSGIDPDGQRWNRKVTVSFLAEQVSAAMSLSSSPSIVRQTAKADPTCSADRPLYQQLNLQELNGAEVRLTRFVADSADLSDQIQSWFGSLRLAPFGTLSAKICWLPGTLPSTRNFEVEGVDGGGRTVKANLQVSFKTAALIPGTLAVSKDQVQLVAASGSASASLNVSLPGDEAWSVTTYPANQKSAWLTVAPKSGRGPAQVNLAASAAGLSNGVYMAKLIFQSEFMTPQFIEVPVVFLVGVSGGSTITGAQNAASFKQAFAPGMLMSAYGTKLANSTQSATSLPLPTWLDGVSVTVNGLPAPLWFVSPGQINLQIPYETAVGIALVVVNNNGQVSFSTIQVAPTAPGIFNHSGAITPVASAARGSDVSIYLTGEGELTPMIDTGAPPAANTPAAQLPKPRGAVKVTVGGVPAAVTFIGNPWLVGVTQLNFKLAANTPTGAQPVVVTVGGVPSAAQTLTVR
jgi:uncharacterized protein (TIGR03437 family)